MRKSVAILSILTVGFATSTTYLAHELYLRDAGEPAETAHDADRVAAFAAASTNSNDTTRAPIAAEGIPTHASIPATDGAAKAAGAATPAVAAKRDVQNDPGAAYARQLLARLDDSNQRAIPLEEQRTVIRRQYQKLKERLHLSDSAFEQFATLLAEDGLQAQESWARCTVDPTCDPKNPRNPAIDHTQEYQAMLGMDGAEAFTQYRNSINERDTVAQLRGRLPDSNFLPEAQAEKLIAALSDERQQYSKEVAARGANLSGWGTNLGMLWYTEDSGSPEQIVQEATQFSQRLRTRAAGILTPAQLSAYVQMQDELLAMFASNRQPPARQKKSSVTRAS